MNNIEFYRFGFNHYFIDNDNDVEGKIILSYADHFGETHVGISHIEFDCDDLEEPVEDAYLEYIKEHIDDVVHADGI